MRDVICRRPKVERKAIVPVAVYLHAQLDSYAAADDIEAHVLPSFEIVNGPALKGEAHHVHDVDDEKWQTQHDSRKYANFVSISQIQTCLDDRG